MRSLAPRWTSAYGGSVTNRLKLHRESRTAALFCHGIGSAALGTTVYYARHEASDYDFVSLWRRGDDEIYTPVQLKEARPHHEHRCTVEQVNSVGWPGRWAVRSPDEGEPA